LSKITVKLAELGKSDRTLQIASNLSNHLIKAQTFTQIAGELIKAQQIDRSSQILKGAIDLLNQI
jgi:hypothetical protein